MTGKFQSARHKFSFLCPRLNPALQLGPNILCQYNQTSAKYTVLLFKVEGLVGHTDNCLAKLDDKDL